MFLSKKKMFRSFTLEASMRCYTKDNNIIDSYHFNEESLDRNALVSSSLFRHDVIFMRDTDIIMWKKHTSDDTFDLNKICIENINGLSFSLPRNVVVVVSKKKNCFIVKCLETNECLEVEPKNSLESDIEKASCEIISDFSINIFYLKIHNKYEYEYNGKSMVNEFFKLE